MNEDLGRPYYGYKAVNYVSIVLIGGGTAGVALGIVFTVLGSSAWVLALCWALGVVLLACGLFWHLSMACVADRSKAQALRESFVDLLACNWDGQGKALDIGTGLGRTAVAVAKRFPESQLVGVDTWTKLWRLFGMSQAGAEKNARVENVGDRCTFRPGDALHLPFDDGEFQLVVSSFVFHEVHVPDHTVLIQEAARVLAPGGLLFVCDIFPKGYGVKDLPEFFRKVEGVGFEDVSHKPLEETGIDLGGLFNMWGFGYLTARKPSTA